MLTIAYLGPPGTFSEEAARAYGGLSADCLSFASLPAVVTAVETGVASLGVLPIENILEGSVSTTLDLLIHETDLRISGETIVPIRHYLMARAGLQLSQIQVLHAHPQALGQCRRFIEHCLPGVATVAALSNSAAPMAALADERPAAAIGTCRAAELSGATLLAHDIQDRAGNVTRFIVLGHEQPLPTGDDKTSLCFGFSEDRAGLLLDVLGELANAGINMTKLESRPSKEALGRYIFLVDVDGHIDDSRIAAAFACIRAKVGLFKVFGSYPCWR